MVSKIEIIGQSCKNVSGIEDIAGYVLVNWEKIKELGLLYPYRCFYLENNPAWLPLFNLYSSLCFQEVSKNILQVYITNQKEKRSITVEQLREKLEGR